MTYKENTNKENTNEVSFTTIVPAAATCLVLSGCRDKPSDGGSPQAEPHQMPMV